MNQTENKHNPSFSIPPLGILILAAVCLVSFAISPIIGIGFVIGCGITIGTLLLLRVTVRAEHGQEAMHFVDTAVLLENIPMPKNLPVPYAVLDMRGHILLNNEAFAEAFPTKEAAEQAMEPLLKAGVKENEPTLLQTEQKYYTAHIAPCDVLDESGAVGSVLTLTLVDITAAKQKEREMENQEVVVGMLLLDNYEEVLDSLDDSRLPILTALIERKLGQLAASSDGIMKKLEKDRYIFLLPKEKLEEYKEKKFESVNEIKDISVGDHIPVTVSLGFGIGHGSLDLAMKNAKAALDLALGRGGDQILIKDGEKFLFYGGKSGEINRNARVRARVKADALWELLGEANDVIVMGHTNADLDSLGSCVGICAIAKTIGKSCHVLLDYESMGVRRLVSRLKEAGMADLFTDTASAMRSLSEKTLVIIVDTHRATMVESRTVLDAAKKLVVIDHHRRSTDFIEQAVLTYHEPYASSTSELVTEMIRHISEKIQLKNVEADALLAGITVDTKNFCVNTGAVTFEAAAFLRRQGADGIRVRLLFQNDMEVYRAKAFAMQNAEIYHKNIAVSVCPSTSENSLLTMAQAADELMNVIGIKASFVCCLIDHTVHISARSFGDINVQVIMEKLGGGGHLTVSGAQLVNCSIEEAKEKIKAAIDEYLEVEAS